MSYNPHSTGLLSKPHFHTPTPLYLLSNVLTYSPSVSTSSCSNVSSPTVPFNQQCTTKSTETRTLLPKTSVLSTNSTNVSCLKIKSFVNTHNGISIKTCSSMERCIPDLRRVLFSFKDFAEKMLLSIINVRRLV